MGYLDSLGSVMQHDGADHHLVTPASKAAETTPTAGYAMPAVAIHQPGTAAVKASDQPGFLQNATQGMQNAEHPYTAPTIDYQPVQFQQAQLGTYQAPQPNYMNLSHLLQGG